MSESAYIYVIGPLVAGLIGGVSFLFKKWLENNEKKRDEELNERNLRREQIESRLQLAEKRQERTEKKLNMIISIVLSCDNPNCPTRPKLAKWLTDFNEEEN